MPRELPFLTPPLAHLTDFLGLWAMRSDAAAVLFDQVRGGDLTARMAVGMSSPSARYGSTMELVDGADGRRVAVIKATGSLMKPLSWFGTSTIGLRRDIQSAAADKSVTGILLAVESPGGTVAGAMDLATEVKAATRKKPVWAHIDDQAASAAYWMVSQADQVWANNPTALVGNVGTIFAVLDTSGAAEFDGVKMRVFATGELKATGYPGTKLSDEQATMIQGLTDQTQVQFDAGVKAARGLSAEQMKAVRTGEIFTATRAKELRLIDGIRPFGQTLAALLKAE